MRYRALGNTGLMVSEIGLGAEWLERHSAEEVKAVIDCCEEQGINILDCWMPEPKVRSNIGAAIAGKRERWIIQGHFGSTWQNGQYVRTRDMDKVVPAFEDLLEAKQWALDTQKGRRNLDKWELGKIALKLKPEIEARAKANMSAGGRAYRPSEEGSATLPNLPPVDTRKELADSVGLGERTMGKVMQIDEHAPAAVKEALDKKELSINQGYQITKQVEDLPEEQREQAAQEALDILRAKKEIQEKDAEIDREGKIAGVFCKAYEKAVLLDPTEENVRIWAKCTRMTRDEMEDTVKESRELAEVFRTIADLMERLLPERGTL